MLHAKTGAQEFKKAFEEAMEHNENLLAEDEKTAESTGEETPAQAAARESSAKVGRRCCACELPLLPGCLGTGVRGQWKYKAMQHGMVPGSLLGSLAICRLSCSACCRSVLLT